MYNNSDLKRNEILTKSKALSIYSIPFFFPKSSNTIPLSRAYCQFIPTFHSGTRLFVFMCLQTLVSIFRPGMVVNTCTLPAFPRMKCVCVWGGGIIQSKPGPHREPLQHSLFLSISLLSSLSHSLSSTLTFLPAPHSLLSPQPSHPLPICLSVSPTNSPLRAPVRHYVVSSYRLQLYFSAVLYYYNDAYFLGDTET